MTFLRHKSRFSHDTSKVLSRFSHDMSKALSRFSHDTSEALSRLSHDMSKAQILIFLMTCLRFFSGVDFLHET